MMSTQELVRIHNDSAHKSWSKHNQLITYYLPVSYLLRIQQYPVNTTYNTPTKILNNVPQGPKASVLPMSYDGPLFSCQFVVAYTLIIFLTTNFPFCISR